MRETPTKTKDVGAEGVVVQQLSLTTAMTKELEAIYAALQSEYERLATALQFTCEGCPDNCCDSYFLHHTYIEWAYFWQGIETLAENERAQLIQRARIYQKEAAMAQARGERPQLMCPVNVDGLCLLYRHRLLVCRTHGVPAMLRWPDGRRAHFPGCFRCQDIVQQRADLPIRPVDRSQMLQRLACLENAFLENQRPLYPKLRHTIAEMILKGPPSMLRG